MLNADELHDIEAVIRYAREQFETSGGEVRPLTWRTGARDRTEDEERATLAALLEKVSR